METGSATGPAAEERECLSMEERLKRSLIERTALKIKKYFGHKQAQNIPETAKVELLLYCIDSLQNNGSTHFYNKLFNENEISKGIKAFLRSKLPAALLKYLVNDIKPADSTTNERIRRNPSKLINFLYKSDVIKSVDASEWKYQGSCMAILARAYEEGLLGLRKSLKMAILIYKWAIIYGCPFSTFRMAFFLENGIVVDRNHHKAAYLYRISYKLGYLPGIHRYSIILIKGSLNVERDIMTGLHLLGIAVERANQEYPYPYYDLGLYYSTAKTEQLDLKYAFKLFMKGAQLGCKNCQFQVAKYYKKGTGCSINLNKSFMWYKIAAENGHRESQYLVANIILNRPKYMEKTIKINLEAHSRNGTRMDEEAFQLALSAANEGHSKAQWLVAECLERGIGTKRNRLLSVWYGRRAATAMLKEREHLSEIHHQPKKSHQTVSQQSQTVNKSGQTLFGRVIAFLLGKK